MNNTFKNKHLNFIYINAITRIQLCIIELTIKENKGKESENSYQKLNRSQWTGTRTHTRKQNQNILTEMAVLLNQKRANVCEPFKIMSWHSLVFPSSWRSEPVKLRLIIFPSLLIYENLLLNNQNTHCLKKKVSINSIQRNGNNFFFCEYASN